MQEKGYVHVYTGNGKGKTTAMLGLALRATGAGFNIYIGQFLKGSEYNEIKALKMYLPSITVEQYNKDYMLGQLSDSSVHDAQEGLKRAKEAMLCGKYNLVMLDEINVAVLLGLIDEEDVLDLIESKPGNVELVLTGRYVTPQIVAAADLVSEIRDIKHYYNEGVPAREGIEF
jgi:cob(I)alamin adenosyltransferase